MNERIPRHAVAHTATATTLLWFVIALAGCDGSEIVVPKSDAPFLYLIVGQETLTNVDGERRQHALLLTTGSVLEPGMRYRRAERFRIERTSDGATFRFRNYELPYEFARSDIGAANYYLPDSLTSGEGTRPAIRPGASYRVLIETGGVRIEGSTRVPEEFTVSLHHRNGRPVAVWPTVAGAAAYLISAYPHPPELQLDTAWVIPEDVPADRAVIVRAIDRNLYRYMGEEHRARAGIDNGYGVFGAVTVERLELGATDTSTPSQHHRKGP